MRADAALDLAAQPDEADPDDARAALAALRAEVLRLRRDRDESRARIIEAADALIDRDNLVRQRASAVHLMHEAGQRLAAALAVLDELAPERARDLSAGWDLSRY